MNTATLLLIAVLSCFYIVAVSTTKDAPKLFPNADMHWKAFVDKYHKQYEQNEVATRFSIFRQNLALIDAMNQGDLTATFGITKFTDLTSTEFSNSYLMPNFNPTFTTDKYEAVKVTKGDPPTNFDWRDKKAVTPVKDQGQCGSCWAFSATEEIESQWILKGYPVALLAPQQIVDCDKSDAGCSGGDTPTAYEYVIQAGGMEPESNYPYKAKDEKCAFKSAAVVVNITSWKYVVEKKNETEMLSALYNAGPLSICVDAEPWQHYVKGILSDKCGHSLDHCVELVGYGTEDSTLFWAIRNSWGTTWGEDGYIRVERNKNLCGVANEVTIAVI